MKKKLKPWKQLEEELKYIADKYTEENGHITIRHKGIQWGIASEMIQYFGTEIDVEEFSGPYIKNTYYGKKFYWNELCFESEFGDFIKEEEMKIGE